MEVPCLEVACAHVHVHQPACQVAPGGSSSRLPGRQTAGSELGEKEEAEAHLSGCR